ncbi:hypothetical protein HYC85_029052 [Camellia sinensis]|uniref:Retrotransposon gag domain-containing protein n=1 Tax=Camellia sinensis TaxID=4442 RepID=A0A7J7FY29_CAMSI|nr:hypothetical protein HYC85_029052 [Camellia sinensis]
MAEAYLFRFKSIEHCDDTDAPTGLAPPPILPQPAKTQTNLSDSPFEFEVDPTVLKVSKLEKLFKKSQGVKSIPNIEDGYTDSTVTLPDRFKMSHIDRFDGSGDPMVHIRLFSDILRPMGLSRLQKLSLVGRTLSGVAGIWYAKLEDSVKRNWEKMAEAIVAQYSYNTQIEITTRDLETTRQELKESFSDFITRWRAKASMMTIRPTDKDQIQMIEDALKQGLIDNDREQPRRTFNYSMNAGTSSAAAARALDVSMVTATAPRTLTATPFTGASGKRAHEALEPRPLPETLPPFHNLAKYCAFHQQHGHDTDHCFRLRHEIQDLIDNRVIVPPEKPNVTTNPLPPHNQAPPLKRINSIQTGVVSYDPSIYITASHLSKPEVFIPDGTDLCMLDISRTQPEPMVVIIEDRTGMILEESGTVDSGFEEFGSFAEEAYNPSGYITSTGQVRPNVELPVGAEICVQRLQGGLMTNQILLKNLSQNRVCQGPGNQNASPESTGAKNFARDLSILNTKDVEQQAALKQFKREGIEDSERARKAKAPVGTERAVCTRTERATSTWTEGVVGTRIVVTEPDRCLSAVDGMWWEDDDLCFAHTNEDWGNNQPDDTWYIGEVDHMTRSGRYFKSPHLDQPEASGKGQGGGEAERKATRRRGCVK